jgi:hypothetical protein
VIRLKCYVRGAKGASANARTLDLTSATSYMDTLYMDTFQDGSRHNQLARFHQMVRPPEA